MEGQLWSVVYEVVVGLGNEQGFKGKWFSDARVVLVFLWAVLHDRPTGWACDPTNWPEGERWCSLPS